jgi:hypothetical protein
MMHGQKSIKICGILSIAWGILNVHNVMEASRSSIIRYNTSDNLQFHIQYSIKGSRGGVRSTRGLGPTMTARGQSIGISIGMLPQTLIMSRLDQPSRLGDTNLFFSLSIKFFPVCGQWFFFYQKSGAWGRSSHLPPWNATSAIITKFEIL